MGVIRELIEECPETLEKVRVLVKIPQDAVELGPRCFDLPP